MRIRQIVFSAQDLQANSALLAQVLELPTPFQDLGVGKFGLDNAVFCFGDQFIEIVSPLQPDTAAGRTMQRRGGDCGYMLILQTEDFDAAQQRLDAHGVRRVWNIAHDDIRATHLHPKDIGGTIVSIDQPVPPQAWRWGGPDWQVAPGLPGAQRVVSVALQAADPQAMALRWAQALGLQAPQAQGGAWCVPLAGGELGFVPQTGLGDGICGFGLAVADPTAVLGRAAALGLAVDGSAFSLMGVRVELQALPAS